MVDDLSRRAALAEVEDNASGEPFPAAVVAGPHRQAQGPGDQRHVGEGHFIGIISEYSQGKRFARSNMRFLIIFSRISPKSSELSLSILF